MKNRTPALTPTFEPSFLQIENSPVNNEKLTYYSGMVAWCLDVMVKEEDINKARQRNQNNRNDGRRLMKNRNNFLCYEII